MASSLLARLRSHLTRQTEWLEEVLEELDAVHMDAERLNMKSAQHTLEQRVAERKQWEAEEKRLAAEWRAESSSFPEAERADIRARIERRQAMAKRVSEAYLRVAEETEARKRRTGDELARLGRGRSFLRQMHLEPPSSGILNRKA